MVHLVRLWDLEGVVEVACARSGIMALREGLVVVVLVGEEVVVVVDLRICLEVIGIVVSDCLKVDVEAVVDGRHIEKRKKAGSKAVL